MDIIAKYLIQSSVSIMLFYLVFKLLFRGDTNFKLQRLYMVSSMILAHENVHLLRGVHPSLDTEALRVVSAMPDWKPGKDDNGKPVNVEYNLPISFKLDDNAGKEKKEE